MAELKEVQGALDDALGFALIVGVADDRVHFTVRLKLLAPCVQKAQHSLAKTFATQTPALAQLFNGPAFPAT